MGSERVRFGLKHSAMVCFSLAPLLRGEGLIPQNWYQLIDLYPLTARRAPVPRGSLFRDGYAAFLRSMAGAGAAISTFVPTVKVLRPIALAW
jgi:hypothetical protein